jgi:hypothetical protein
MRQDRGLAYFWTEWFQELNPDPDEFALAVYEAAPDLRSDEWHFLGQIFGDQNKMEYMMAVARRYDHFDNQTVSGTLFYILQIKNNELSPEQRDEVIQQRLPLIEYKKSPGKMNSYIDLFTIELLRRYKDQPMTEAMEEVLAEYETEREATLKANPEIDPEMIPTAGSFFDNILPEKIPMN